MAPLTKLLFAGWFVIGPACGQQVVTPTPDPVGSPRGEEARGYNILNSFESGHRFRSVGGNLAKYRADVNYNNGFGLIAGHLAINATSGRGRWFDEILVDAGGLNSDPYRFAALRIQKSRAYRYDLSFRQNEYVNPGLTTGDASGLHRLDTSHAIEDHDVTLLPQAWTRFLLGYTHSSQTGAGFSAIDLFESRADSFPIFSDVRRTRSEYRVGNELEWRWGKLVWLRGWEHFQEDTAFPYAAGAQLSSFQRREPSLGASPFWRVVVFGGSKIISASAKFTHTAGRRAFVTDENAAAANPFGIGVERQVLAFGDARRPVTTGNAGLNFHLTRKLHVTQEVAVYNSRIEGTAAYREYVNAGLDSALLYFRFLGIRTVSGSTVVNYQAHRKFGLGAGYHYSNRLIRSIENTQAGLFEDGLVASRTNQLHSGTLQLRFRIVTGLSASVDGEIGRAGRPEYPGSDGRYNAAGGRVEYRRGKLRAWTASRANYNNNSVALSIYSSQGRTHQFHLSWTPRDWLTFDCDYTKLHLTTTGGVMYFAGGQLVSGGRSYYFSNIHSGNLGAQFQLMRRATLYIGFSRVEDAGDGRGHPPGPGIGSTLPVLQAAQAFPLAYQTPLARLSVPIVSKLRWNIGYQYYGYREEFFQRENYRAHTGYSSLSWSF